MKYAILSIALLVLVAACAQFKTQPTGAVTLPSADETALGGTETQSDCFLMKHNRVGVYNCFGCSNGNCNEADTNWNPVDSNDPHARVKCIAAPRGCVLA